MVTAGRTLLGTLLVLIACSSSCKLPDQDPGYLISYTVNGSSHWVHTTRRPFLIGGEVYFRTDSLHETWLGSGWAVQGFRTTAETDTVGVWWPWLTVYDSIPAEAAP